MIKDREDLKRYIKADYNSYNMSHPFAARLTYGENWEMFSYVRNLRYLEYYTNKKKKYPWDLAFKFFYWLKHRRNCKKTLITISPNTCGPGLHLVHRGFRRIGGMKTMRIGANCTVL